MNSRFLYFMVLIGILFLGIVTFMSAGGDKTIQIMVSGITAASYVLWGIMYHLVTKDFHVKVVVEYLFVGLIAYILILTVLLA